MAGIIAASSRVVSCEEVLDQPVEGVGLLPWWPVTSLRQHAQPGTAAAWSRCSHRRTPRDQAGGLTQERNVLCELAVVHRRTATRVGWGVLDSIAGALQLDESEREHLFDLARAASAPRAASRGRRLAASRECRPVFSASSTG